MTSQTKITIIGWAAFIIMLVLFLQRCGTGNCPTSTNIHDTIQTQHWDSASKEITVKVKGPSGVIYDTVPQKIDTAKILQKFYNKYFYSQPISDSLISAIITDTVSQNKIVGKGFIYKMKKPQITTIINNTKVDSFPVYNNRELFLGGFIASNTIGTSVGIGPQISLVTKKNTMYHVNYDLLQKRVEFGAHIKLQLKK